MSTASQKAADRIHADISAMHDDARRYAGLAATPAEFKLWDDLRRKLFEAKATVVPCMSERDARIARKG